MWHYGPSVNGAGGEVIHMRKRRRCLSRSRLSSRNRPSLGVRNHLGTTFCGGRRDRQRETVASQLNRRPRPPAPLLSC